MNSFWIAQGRANDANGDTKQGKPRRQKETKQPGIEEEISILILISCVVYCQRKACPFSQVENRKIIETSSVSKRSLMPSQYYNHVLYFLLILVYNFYLVVNGLLVLPWIPYFFDSIHCFFFSANIKERNCYVKNFGKYLQEKINEKHL